MLDLTAKVIQIKSIDGQIISSNEKLKSIKEETVISKLRKIQEELKC